MDDDVLIQIQSLGDLIRDTEQQLKEQKWSALEIKNYAPLQDMYRELNLLLGESDASRRGSMQDQMKLDSGTNPKNNKPRSGGDGGHGGKRRDRVAGGFAHRIEKLQMELLQITEIAQEAVQMVTQKRKALEKEFKAVREQMEVQRATLEDLEIERDNLQGMLERKRQQQQQQRG